MEVNLMETTHKKLLGKNEVPMFGKQISWPRVRKVLGTILAYATLLALSAVILLPLGWILTVALKPDNVAPFSIPVQWFPTKYWHWENFVRTMVDESKPFLIFTRNTFIIVAGNILGTVFSCTLVAYAFARLRFRGRELLFNILIITMLIPYQALMIPQFIMFFKMGWYGTYLPLIVPSFTGNAFFIFLMRQYMRSFPKDLDDASRIDGCNYFQTFWYIILPLAKPVIAVCVVFVFMGQWSNLLGPLIYLDKTSMFTVAIGMANYITRADPAFNLLMAANLIMMMPSMLLYFFAQKQLIGGIASVGLKG
jgi:ABC-type glycerol-3-phosphate transport system permease component